MYENWGYIYCPEGLALSGGVSDIPIGLRAHLQSSHVSFGYHCHYLPMVANES